MTSTLELTLLYLVAAVLGVVVCRLARLPPMLGYLAVGVLIGPNAMALAGDSPGVTYLAEFGIRSEVDVFVDAGGEVHVTGGLQARVLPILADPTGSGR